VSRNSIFKIPFTARPEHSDNSHNRRHGARDAVFDVQLLIEIRAVLDTAMSDEPAVAEFGARQWSSLALITDSVCKLMHVVPDNLREKNIRYKA
jgi:hypothetical protein